MASDYFWASFVLGFLTPHGVLSVENERRLRTEIASMRNEKFVTIPQDIMVPLFRFLRYTILGALHLNKLGASDQNVQPVLEPHNLASRKRKRIVERLARGFSPRKLRKFSVSRVKQAVQGIDPTAIEDQVRILEAHDIVLRPTQKTVELMRVFNERSRAYLGSSCAFSIQEIGTLEEAAATLID